MLPLVFLISRRPVCRTSGFTASMWAKSEGSGLGRSGAGLNTPQIRREPAQTSPHTGQKPKPAQTRHELAQTSPRRPETQKHPKTQDRPRHPFPNGAKRNPTGQNTHHSLCVSCLQLVHVCSPMQPISADSFVVLRTCTAKGRAGAAAAAPPTEQLGGIGTSECWDHEELWQSCLCCLCLPTNQFLFKTLVSATSPINQQFGRQQ